MESMQQRTANEQGGALPSAPPAAGAGPGAAAAPGEGAAEWISRLQASQDLRDQQRSTCRQMLVHVASLLPSVGELEAHEHTRLVDVMAKELEKSQLVLAKKAHDMVANDWEELRQLRSAAVELDAKLAKMNRTYLREITTTRDANRHKDDAVERSLDAISGRNVEFYEPLQYMHAEVRSVCLAIVEEKIKALFDVDPSLKDRANAVDMARFEDLLAKDRLAASEKVNAGLRKEVRELWANNRKCEQSAEKLQWELSSALACGKKVSAELLAEKEDVAKLQEELKAAREEGQRLAGQAAAAERRAEGAEQRAASAAAAAARAARQLLPRANALPTESAAMVLPKMHQLEADGLPFPGDSEGHLPSMAPGRPATREVAVQALPEDAAGLAWELGLFDDQGRCSPLWKAPPTKMEKEAKREAAARAALEVPSLGCVPSSGEAAAASEVRKGYKRHNLHIKVLRSNLEIPLAKVESGSPSRAVTQDVPSEVTEAAEEAAGRQLPQAAQQALQAAQAMQQALQAEVRSLTEEAKEERQRAQAAAAAAEQARRETKELKQELQKERRKRPVSVRDGGDGFATQGLASELDQEIRVRQEVQDQLERTQAALREALVELEYRERMQADQDGGTIGRAKGALVKECQQRVNLLDQKTKAQEMVSIQRAQLQDVLQQNQVLQMALEEMQQEVFALTKQLRRSAPEAEEMDAHLEAVISKMEKVAKRGGGAYLRLTTDVRLREVAANTRRENTELEINKFLEGWSQSDAPAKSPPRGGAAARGPSSLAPAGPSLPPMTPRGGALRRAGGPGLGGAGAPAAQRGPEIREQMGSFAVGANGGFALVGEKNAHRRTHTAF